MREIIIDQVKLALSRKSVKYLRIVVAPPDGQVRVSVPQHWPQAAVHAALVSRLPWIKQQQAYFAAQPPRYIPEYVDGEQHHVWGIAHRLVLSTTARNPQVKYGSEGELRLFIRSDSTVAQRQALLENWYRTQLRDYVSSQLAPLQQALGVKIKDWGIKRMKTRWGSCNITAGRIWLNLTLAQLPRHCCEYVLVHELAHLHERYHNSRFWSIVEQHLPSWRESRAYLKQFDRSNI